MKDEGWVTVSFRDTRAARRRVEGALAGRLALRR
jgi:hypothetical protein